MSYIILIHNLYKTFLPYGATGTGAKHPFLGQ